MAAAVFSHWFLYPSPPTAVLEEPRCEVNARPKIASRWALSQLAQTACFLLLLVSGRGGA